MPRCFRRTLCINDMGKATSRKLLKIFNALFGTGCDQNALRMRRLVFFSIHIRFLPLLFKWNHCRIGVLIGSAKQAKKIMFLL